MTPRPSGLDVVIVITDPARLDELGRAVFSVLLAEYRPLTAVVVCQGFGPAALDAVRAGLAPLAAIAGDAGLRVLDDATPGPPGARAALLNRGLQQGTARYAAFLGAGELVYPEAYPLLIAELERSGAAIAFGGAQDAAVCRDGLVPHVTAKRRVPQAKGLRQLLDSGSCPLHSLVLDRGRIHPDDLVFDQSLAVLEADDLLLRLCARYPSSFALTETLLAERLLEDDFSDPAREATQEAAQVAAQVAAKAEIWPRKAGHVLSSAVQKTLGIDEPGLTTKAYLDRGPGAS